MATFSAAITGGTIYLPASVLTDESGNSIASATAAPAGTERGLITRPISAAPVPLATYTYIVPSTAVGANKLFLDLFNGVGSGKIIKVISVRPIVDTDLAVVGVVGIRLALFRTSAVGTGGTAAAYQSATIDVAGGTISPQDTSNAALPAQVTARHLLAGGATLAEWLRGMYVMGEESANSFAYLFQGQHNMLDLDDGTCQLLTLREGQGILVKQGAIASVGNVRFRVTFTVE